MAGVSRSGFYSWRYRKEHGIISPTRQRRIERRQRVCEIHEENHNVYGQRKICAQLNRDGIACCVNTVSADCRATNIQSCTRTKYRVKTTDSNHDQPIAQNLMARDFTASRPCEKWVTDITRQGAAADACRCSKEVVRVALLTLVFTQVVILQALTFDKCQQRDTNHCYSIGSSQSLSVVPTRRA